MIENIKKHLPTAISFAFAFLLFRCFRGAVMIAFFIFTLSYILHRAVDFLKDKLKIPKSIGCTVLMMSIGTLSAFALTYIAKRVVFEGKRISEYIAANTDVIAQTVSGLFDKINGGLFRFFEQMGIEFFDSYDVYTAIFELIGSIASDAAKALPSAAIGVGVSLPDSLFAVVSGAFAVFYLARDWEIIMERTAKMLPPTLRRRSRKIKAMFFDAVKSWAKTSLFGAAASFIFIFLGTTLLRFDCPLLISLIAAAIDALPVVGCGLLLLPWGFFLILSGAKYKGVGLIIIYAVVFLFRRISEPKMLVKKSSVHPLFALAALYFCTHFFGIIGALVTPIVISLVCEANQSI